MGEFWNVLWVIKKSIFEYIFKKNEYIEKCLRGAPANVVSYNLFFTSKLEIIVRKSTKWKMHFIENL